MTRNERNDFNQMKKNLKNAESNGTIRNITCGLNLNTSAQYRIETDSLLQSFGFEPVAVRENDRRFDFNTVLVYIYIPTEVSAEEKQFFAEVLTA